MAGKMWELGRADGPPQLPHVPAAMENPEESKRRTYEQKTEYPGHLGR